MTRWLENFSQKDLPLIYDFLSVFEFLPYFEMDYRLEEKLKATDASLRKDANVTVVDFAKFEKSGTLVSCPLTNTPQYEKIEKANTVLLA